MRILAIQLKRIGDLALTTPALHAMRTAGARITLVVMEGSAALLPMMSASADEALVYHVRGNSNSRLWRKLWRGGFDACVDFTGRDRSALMTLLSRASRRITADSLLRRGGWRRLPYNAVVPAPVRSQHTVDHYLDFLAPLRLPPGQTPADAPVLHLPEEFCTGAVNILASVGVGEREKFVVVHPGTARTEKYWMPERWAEVISFCQERLGWRCVLTGGRHDPEEQTHIAAIRAALAARGESCADLAGQLDLSTLTAMLARAALVLGVDSGPMHLAAAFPRPQIVLFGPTNPFHWRPRHPWAFVLRAGHGDLPLKDFQERSPGAPLDGISTRAVIGCIEGAVGGLPPPV